MELSDRIEALDADVFGSLFRCFVKGGADYILLDGWSPEWQRKDVADCLEEGLLTFCDDTSNQRSDDQYTALCYRPVDGLVDALRAKETPNA